MTDFSRVARRRAGFGLVEIVGVLVTTGLLLSFASVVLSRAFMSNAQALGHLQRMQRLQNAHHRFLADVHQAIRCELQDDGLTLDLKDGRRIRYNSSTSLDATSLDATSLDATSLDATSLVAPSLVAPSLEDTASQSGSAPEGSSQPQQGPSSPLWEGLTLTRIMSHGGEELGREQLKLDRVRQIRWSINRVGRIPLVRCELISIHGPPLTWLSRMHMPQAPVAETNSDGHIDSELESSKDAKRGGA